MINISYLNEIFKIDKKYFDEKSFLYSSLEFIENNSIMFELNENISLFDFKQYLLFLQFKDFDITNGFLKLLDFDRGIKNNQNHPLDYFKIKIKEDLIRDNFYQLKLYEDPYFNLFEVIEPPVKENMNLIDSILEIIDNKAAIVAGGSLISKINNNSDIDIFLVGINENEANKIIEKLFKINKFIIAKKNNQDKNSKYIKSYLITLTEHTYSFFFRRNGHRDDQKIEIQIILRLYKSPAEIIYGFDIDCCGFLYDGKTMFCTERAKYSYENKINHFDIDRMSPSYAYRLAKYKKRGYKIWLSNFNKNKINKHNILQHFGFDIDKQIYYYKISRGLFVFSSENKKINDYINMSRDYYMYKYNNMKRNDYVYISESDFYSECLKKFRDNYCLDKEINVYDENELYKNSNEFSESNKFKKEIQKNYIAENSLINLFAIKALTYFNHSLPNKNIILHK